MSSEQAMFEVKEQCLQGRIYKEGPVFVKITGKGV
jgi:hypothetical protein